MTFLRIIAGGLIALALACFILLAIDLAVYDIRDWWRNRKGD